MNVAGRQMRSLVLVALVAVGLQAEAAAQAAIRAITPRSVDIYNFAQVNERYYRGGQPLEDDYADLAALGVTTIINLTSAKDGRPEEPTLAEQHGMTYVNIPMSTRKPPTDEEIQLFLSTVEQSEGAVYVHCVGGRHRTGVMTAIYRMTRDGLTGEQAFKEMKRYKYGPDFLHPEFKRFVRNYQPKAFAASSQ